MRDRRTPLRLAAVAALLASCGGGSGSGARTDLPDPVPGLETRVRAAFDRLWGPPGAGAAYGVAYNRHLADVIAACVARGGFEYRDTGDGEIWPSDLITHHVQPEWWDPPDVALARLGGFGWSWDPDAFDAAAGGPVREQPPDRITPYVEAMTTEQRAAYDEVLMGCYPASDPPKSPTPSSQLSDPLLHGGSGVEAIAERAQAASGYPALRAAYATCIADHGLAFSDPDEARQIEDEIYFRADAVTVDVREFDRKAAVADATCRAPLYGSYLALAADEWEAWLVASADDLARIDALHQRYLDESGLAQVAREVEQAARERSP